MDIPRSHSMDREYEWSEMMDIYANADPQDMTETENTKRHQTPQRTEGDCGRMGSSRVFTVCLAMMCVFLLTAVMVLGVKLNKNCAEETHQMINKEERNNCDLIKQRENLDGWVCYKSSLYFISSEKKNWDESRTYCREKGADLLIINNSEEQEFIKSVPEDTGVWIGLSDRDVEDTWKWVDGSKMTLMIWRDKEPNGNTNENCVLAYASGWIDHRCHEARKWICEKNI